MRMIRGLRLERIMLHRILSIRILLRNRRRNKKRMLLLFGTYSSTESAYHDVGLALWPRPRAASGQAHDSEQYSIVDFRLRLQARSR